MRLPWGGTADTGFLPNAHINNVVLYGPTGRTSLEVGSEGNPYLVMRSGDYTLSNMAIATGNNVAADVAVYDATNLQAENVSIGTGMNSFGRLIINNSGGLLKADTILVGSQNGIGMMDIKGTSRVELSKRLVVDGMATTKVAVGNSATLKTPGTARLATELLPAGANFVVLRGIPWLGVWH